MATERSASSWAARGPSGRAALEPSAPEFVDGTALYRQGDPAWGARKLGNSATISKSGCALAATAMAIGKISGNPINPLELDRYVDRRNGYSGDALDWTTAAAARGLRSHSVPMRLSTVDANLAQGRPVVIGVDYKRGSAGGANGTDHWLCVTRKDVDESGRTYYAANDSGTGRSVRLYPDRQGRLIGDGEGALGRYRTTNQMRVFTPRDE